MGAMKISRCGRRVNATFILVGLIHAMVTHTAASADLSVQPAVRIEWGVMVPMRDGVQLAANVYHPAAAASVKGPAILTMTPYIADRFHPQAMYFARHGYTFVVVDQRGRGNSQGEYWPYEQEGSDGHDIVAWITGQPWSDRKVAMWGGSAAGYNQWATLKEFPPGLISLVPTASGHPGLVFPAYKNVYSAWSINWLSSVAGRTGNRNLEGDLGYWTQVSRAHYLAQQPFDQLDDRAGMPSAILDRWLSHPSVDGYWDAVVPDPSAYRRIDIPILTITGHYDGAQLGALGFHRLHIKYGSEAGKALHYLVIGPWNHSGTRKPAREIGGVEFGEHSLVDIDQLHLDWYDWTLRGGTRPAFLRDRVAYYVEGLDEWRYAPSIDQIGSGPQRLYLQATDTARSVTHAGHLDIEPGRESSSSYTYDPRDTRSGALEPEYGERYLLDQSPFVNLFDGGLIYDSSALPSGTDIAGSLKAVLWIRMDVPDTDIEITLYELRADGSTIRLTQDLLRARYRKSLRTAKAVPIGELVKYEFSDFAFFARRLAPDSRLRLLIRAPNSIYSQKNYNSGGDVGKESGATARTAHISVSQGGPHASYIELPVERIDHKK